MNGDVEILDVFWNTERIHGIDDIVPPVLAYADLFTTTKGRDIEAARMIYDQFIRPTFRNQITSKTGEWSFFQQFAPDQSFASTGLHPAETSFVALGDVA